MPVSVLSVYISTFNCETKFQVRLRAANDQLHQKFNQMPAFEQVDVGVRRTGVSVVVPDNDVARLMYYLNCVTRGAGLDILPNYLIDYRNYRRLDGRDIDLLLEFAALLSPRELINNIIFRDDEGDITGRAQNEFCEIDIACNVVAVERTVVVAGQVRNISKVMFFKSSWLNTNYYRPMARLQDGCVIA